MIDHLLFKVADRDLVGREATLVQDHEFEVFVSYNRKDHLVVAELISRLHDEGIRIWWDRDIVPGRNWPMELETALTTTPAVAIFLGPNGINHYQYNEILRAVEESKNRQISLIPVILPGGSDDLPLPLKSLQYTDFSGPDGLEDEEILARLIAGIKGESLNRAIEEELAQKELRAAILDYYKTQEANCEHLVFTPRQDKDHVRGSDVYVPLNLLVRRDDQPELSLRKDSSSSPVNETFPQQDSTPETQERPRGCKTEDEADLPKEGIRYDLQSAWKRESWETVFRNDGLRLVFTGSAGSGKSFSLTQEIRKRISNARKELENSRSLYELELPILVKASVLVSASQERVTDILLASLSESSPSKRFRNWWHHALNADRGRRLFIIIDGLDELSEDSESLFRKRMRELDALDAASLIISCRTVYFESRRDWIGWGNKRTKVIEIAPLDEQQQLDLIDKWFGDSGRSRAVRSLLETSYAARILCRTPVVLTLVCRTEAITNQPEELTYASLYKVATKELLVGAWRDPSKRPKWAVDQSKMELRPAVEDRMKLVSRIAWRLFEASPSENRFTRTEWLDAASRIASTPGTMRIDVNELLVDLELVGVLIDAGQSEHEQRYSFAHRTFLEYFAAMGMVEQDARWIKTIVEHIWCEREWEEVIRFAASTTSTPANSSRKLLKAIAKETGGPTTPSRPLQWLDQLCWRIAILCFLGLVAIAIVTGLFIKSSPELSAELQVHDARFSKSVEDTSRNELGKTPFELIKLTANHFLEFYSLAVDSMYRQVLLRSDKTRPLSLLLAWVHFLSSILLITLLVTLLGVFLSWLGRKTLYRRSFLKQDDIFRTGLRIQAEVVGLSPVFEKKSNIPRKDVRRVICDLIASERDKSLNIHGATDGGGIPENLLLLLGGNSDARVVLHDEFWSRLVEQRITKLRRKNRGYERILRWYGWVLRHLTKTNVEVRLRSEDLRSVDTLIWEVGYSKTVASHVVGKLSRGTKNALNPDIRSDWSKEQLHSALLTELNELLQGPLLYEPLEFRYVDLSAETIELLARKPTGAELVRLNRLLLEEAFPRSIQRLQKRSIRFMNWCVLRLMRPSFSGMREYRNLTPGSELDQALRGMALLPNAANRKDILRLLDETTKTTNHLLYAGATLQTFTALDIYAAKILVLTGGPEDKERLVELANRHREGNSNTPLAVKELSAIDKRQGIRSAVACLTEKWKENSYYGWNRDSQFVDVLRNSEFNQVVNEIVKMDIPDRLLWDNVLVSWGAGFDSDSARDFYQQMATSDVLPQYVKDTARGKLQSSFQRAWLHTSEWLEEYAKVIKTLLENDDLESAVRSFEESISSYYVKYGSNNLSQALDTLAAACNETLLDKWFEKQKYNSDLLSQSLILARLGQGPNGRVVERALIKWAKSFDFDRNPYGYDIKEAAVCALGELGTKDAGLTLMAILDRALSPRQRVRRMLIPTVFDNTSMWITMVTALGKVEANKELGEFEREEVFRGIQRTLKGSKNWVVYHVAARSMYTRNRFEALRLLLNGYVNRGREGWKPEYGVEPQLHDYALGCRARIRKVSQERTWHVATSPSLKRPIRV